MIPTAEDEEYSDKIIFMSQYEYLRGHTNEDRKKRHEKIRKELERKRHNESVLYKLGIKPK
jgi:hypothetical protein